MSLPYEALQWELNEEDKFLKKYKQCTVKVRAEYIVTLEPEDMAELDDGKAITDFDRWDDERVNVEIIDTIPEE